MAFLSHHTRDRWRRGLADRLRPPLDDFIVVALLFGAGVVLLASLMPGGDPGGVTAAGLAFAAAAGLTGRSLRRDYPHDALGLCNVVTLGRLALTSALLVPVLAGAGASWAVLAVAALALSLDGVDGWFARRQGLASGFGARFDMEVDSALALLLAVNAVTGSEAGLLAVGLGLPRYLFGAAGAALPWLRRDLPERFSRKAVCVLQLGVLIGLQAPVVPAGTAMILVALAAAALAWSFALDLRWLWQHRT